MNKWLRRILIGLGVLLALPVAFYLLLVLVNLRDDAPDPALEKLLSAAPPQIPAENNAYFDWIGLDAPEGADAHAWGRRWIAEVLVLESQATPNGTIQPASEAGRRKRADFGAKSPCSKAESCLAEVAANPARARELLEQGRWLLARGDAALERPAYQEVWRPGLSVASPLSVPATAGNWQQLSRLRFALAASEGRHAEALDGLQREIAFRLRQLQGSWSLIGKMSAVNALTQRYLLLNQYLHQHPDAAREQMARINGLLTAWPSGSTHLGPALESELRQVARLLQSDKLQLLSGLANKEDPPLLARLATPLFLTNASINELHALYRPWIELDGLNGEAYRQAIARANATAGTLADDPYRLRNPIGHILNSIALPGFGQYFCRRDTLLALRPVLALQADLLQRGVNEAGAVGSALAASPALIHAYTGQRPVWDAAKRSLRFEQPSACGEPVNLTF